MKPMVEWQVLIFLNLALEQRAFNLNRIAALIFDYRKVFFEKPVPTFSHLAMI